MKKYYTLLKDNFTLIVAIPPFLGAIWQLIELSRIDLSYIRFFSISQLVPDGSLILVSLILVFYSAFCLKLLLDNLKGTEETNEKAKKEKYQPITGLILSLIGIGILYFGLTYANDYFIKNLKSILAIWLIVPLNILILIISILFLENGLSYVENIFSKSRVKRLLIYYTLIFIFIFSNYIKLYYLEFNKIILLPKDLINLKSIEKQIKDDYPSSTINIKYLNDKYIFYSIVDSLNNEKIKIINFENLFIN